MDRLHDDTGRQLRQDLIRGDAPQPKMVLAPAQRILLLCPLRTNREHHRHLPPTKLDNPGSTPNTVRTLVVTGVPDTHPTKATMARRRAVPCPPTPGFPSPRRAWHCLLYTSPSPRD